MIIGLNICLKLITVIDIILISLMLVRILIKRRLTVIVMHLEFVCLFVCYCLYLLVCVCVSVCAFVYVCACICKSACKSVS